MTVKVLFDKTPKLISALSGDRLGRAVVAGGFVLETAVKISMSAASHTGAIYTRRGRSHQASAPGETPAVDMGILVNSISTELESSSATDAWAQVGTDKEYGEFLEFGTSKMAPRPFMRPGFDNNVTKIEDTIRKFAKQAIDDATR
jgi:HK97 gp10 family phage protein